MAEKLSKIKDLFFSGLREDDFEEEDFADEEPSPSNGPVITKPFANSKIVNISPSPSQLKVVIFEPGSYDEAPTIVDNLKNRKVVVVNLEHIRNAEITNNLFQFLSGAIYSMDGDIRKISNKIFVLAPPSIEIDANIKKELETKGLFKW